MNKESTVGYSSDARRKLLRKIMMMQQRRKQKMVLLAGMIGMYYLDIYSNKAPRRVAVESGYDWVMRTLGRRTSCYNMFRMHRPVFEMLHSVLVEKYELKSTRNMSSIEALGLFLWIVGAPNQLDKLKIALLGHLQQ